MRSSLAQDVRLSIVNPKVLSEALGYKASPASGGVLILCPFHGDTNASCSVRIAKDGTIGFKCFSCGEGGDALKLIGRTLGLSMTGKHFTQVLREGARIAGRFDLLDAMDRGFSNTVRTSKAVQQPPPPVPKRPRMTDDRRHEILLWLLERCPLTGDVLEYCYRRGVAAHAQAFGCGALPMDWEPVYRELVEEFGAVDLEASGLLSRKGFFMPRSHRFMIPWCDGFGRIETLELCSIAGSHAKGPKRLFLAGCGPKSPFGVHIPEALYPMDPLVICEGAIDTFSRRALALRDGECLQAIGVASVTILFAYNLRELSRDRDVVISLDADSAGEMGAERIRQACLFAKSIRRERPRGCNDVNEALLMAREVTS